jgi:hypothetical protein
MSVALLVVVAVLGDTPGNSAPGALGPPRFMDETASSGIDHVYGGEFPYSVGGGVAVLDCMGDGRPDLYLAGGSHPAALYRNDSPVGGPLRFTRLADPATDLTGVLGAYPMDIDGDGRPDLVVLRDGGNVLLRGLGGCRFARANEALRLDPGTATTTAFSATWEDGARLPTLAFGNYVDPASQDPHHLCEANVLVRPNRAGTGYATPLPLTPSWCALSMLFSDWDRSARRDLRVSNDAHYYRPTDGEEQLWRIAPDEPPRLYGATDGWQAVQVEGMGIASYDLSGAGYPDYFLTSQGANRLQTLATGPDHPTYRDSGLARGVNAAHPFAGDTTLPSTAWHAEFEDVNNDGFVDLFIAKGNVDAQPDYAQQDPSDLLLGQADGTFREAAGAANLLTLDRGRGAALADFNLSGLLSLVEVNYGTPVRVWRNVGSGTASQAAPMGNWLELRASQPGPNVDAIGAWIEVRTGGVTRRRELTVGGGHASGELGWLHFGLGAARAADVRAIWPDGRAGPWLPTTANEFLVIDRATTGEERWQPAAS